MKITFTEGQKLTFGRDAYRSSGLRGGGSYIYQPLIQNICGSGVVVAGLSFIERISAAKWCIHVFS